jgi:6-phosphofructokinase 2
MPRIITLTPNPTFDFACDAPFVEANRKLRCVNPQSHPGGGGVNVARAARRLGADVVAVFPFGGVYGEAMTRLLAEENVPMRAVPAEGATRIAFHVHDLNTGDEYRFNLPGEEMSKKDADALLEAVEKETRKGDFVVGSGSLPPGAAADLWARAAASAKRVGARFTVDSISGLAAALDEGVFLLRQNKHEYQELAGGRRAWPDGVAEFARDLIAKGAAERVVITHGSDGSMMVMRDSVVRAPAFKVKKQSAVGAGDSFVAALLVAMGKGWDDEDALRYASAGAAATRLRKGTALFEAEDVDRLFAARESAR